MAIQPELYAPLPSVTTVLVARNLPPLKVSVAPATGAPPLLRTSPLIRPAVDTKIFVGLGSAVAFSVDVAKRALLCQPVLPAVIASDLRAFSGMVKLPLLS